MKELLTKIFGEGDIAWNIFIAGSVAVLFLIVIGMIVRKFSKKDMGRVFQAVDCFNCGWRGKVSRYVGRCPQCNQRLGEQKARRKV